MTEQVAPAGRSYWQTAVVYAAIGLLVYGRILTAGFAGDDWHFLTIIQRAHNALVAFTPFNGFTRPILAFTYYLNYRLFGLWPLPAHTVGVCVHLLNAWLLYALARRIVPSPNHWIAFGAGLVFLVFAGHSEAISWIAGMADALVVPFLIGALLCFDRALTGGRPGRWMATGWIVGAAGLLGKETAIVLPALACLFGVLRSGVPPRQRFARTSIFCAGASVVPLGFLAFRMARFGSITGTYSSIASGPSQVPNTLRMFLLRAFLPPGRLPVSLWIHSLDLAVFAAGAAAIAWVMWRRPEDRRPLLFVTGALVISLAPVLPLSVSLVNTGSERYVYLASVFSLLLLVWLIDRVLQSRALVAVALAAITLANWRALNRANAEWIEGGALFHAVVADVLDLCHAQRDGLLAPIVLLNFPDRIYRPFVVVPAVHPALLLMDPSLTDPQARVRIAAVTETTDPQPSTVRRDGRTFHVDVGNDAIVSEWPTHDLFTTVTRIDAHRFDVAVAPSHERLIVAVTTGAHVRRIAELNGIPFGVVDVPAENATCDGASLHFSGWALDDERVERVRIDPGGVAVWRTGTRPDVARMFPTYPNTGRAEWDFDFPCSLVQSARGPLRVRVTAIDNRGEEAELGARTIVPGAKGLASR